MNKTGVAEVSESIGFNRNKEKSNTLKYNTENTNAITLDRETLEEVKSFTSLGSIIDEQGGSDPDLKATIDKVRTTILQLKNIWNSKQQSVHQYQSHNLQYESQDSSTTRS
ncbi:unnamed protein product [Schistosoma mattheei]|uniref:Uncharacterized protein n=1 Tax=Schistosoma mattheei TaxID=31246 RepID=A0A183PPF8_9TREM|nr:unnamed protein product [Schistosoma mattheei]